MDLTEEKIRDRAYQIWEREGRPEGREALHWQMAKEELTREDTAERDPLAAKGSPTNEKPAKAKSTPLGPAQRRGGSKRNGLNTTH